MKSGVGYTPPTVESMTPVPWIISDVPSRRLHRHRYHGVLAPSARLWPSSLLRRSGRGGRRVGARSIGYLRTGLGRPSPMDRRLPIVVVSLALSGRIRLLTGMDDIIHVTVTGTVTSDGVPIEGAEIQIGRAHV